MGIAPVVGRRDDPLHPAGPAEDEVVELACELIRIDTTNTGDPDTVTGEREAAEYVAAKLVEVGYDIEVIESGAPRRENVVIRLPGADRDRGALLVHGHLDVVPADPSEWSVHPFSGTVQDGYVWGRGAVDMKDMVAMMIAVARRFKRDGVVPPRDIVFAFLADEEAGGKFGAQWLVRYRPELFEGCTEAVGEVGGSPHPRRRPARLPHRVRPRRASPGCGCRPGASRGTAPSCTTTTPSPRWPRRWRGWATTSSR